MVSPEHPKVYHALARRRRQLGVAALVFGILSIVWMFIAFVPCLGWLNWINIPFAIVGLIVSIIARVQGDTKGIAGIVLCAIAIAFGGIRLFLGGGIF
jgi:hypothetical protein